MIILRQPTRLEIKIDKNYLGSVITNYVSCRREIKAILAMVKAAFNKKKTLFSYLDSSETRSEVPGKF
jgi:hypothetical protein